MSSVLLFQGDMPDGTHKSDEDCDTNPTYIAAKKAKHLEDSEATPKSCLDVVFELPALLLAQDLRTRCLNQFVFLSLNFKLKDIDQMCCDRKLKD